MRDVEAATAAGNNATTEGAGEEDTKGYGVDGDGDGDGDGGCVTKSDKNELEHAGGANSNVSANESVCCASGGGGGDLDDDGLVEYICSREHCTRVATMQCSICRHEELNIEGTNTSRTYRCIAQVL